MSTPPSAIGAYPVERELGRGGMGIVYLGRDPRLNRPVALKVLPDALGFSQESLARFEREARLLASLNHPNIATIYGIDDAGGQRVIVLEYIPGDTLAARLAAGPLPVAEALDVCRQIALAVEAAHEGGVIHRDLKPGNVKITPDGVVKVLDFGLAKGAEPTGSSANLEHSPTMTYGGTLAGVILGTAGYMSPEQARGKVIDRRTDIWAFGCVLYECLTGARLFDGETVSDTIAKILERDVDWTKLPKQMPAAVRELLRRCLEKDPKRRQRDIGDARLELERAMATSLSSSGSMTAPAPPVSATRRYLNAAALVAAGLAIGAIGAWSLLRSSAVPAQGVTRLSIAVPALLKAASAGTTQDGGTLLMEASTREPGARPQLFVRRLSEDTFKAIPAAEGATGVDVSADGRWLAARVPVAKDSPQLRLLKMPLDGSAPPATVTDWNLSWKSFRWLHNLDILVLDAGNKFVRIPHDRSAPVTFSMKVDEKVRARSLGDVLPGDRGIFFATDAYSKHGYQEDQWVLDLKTQEAHLVAENIGSPTYAANLGQIVFANREALTAAPFSLDTLKVTGDQAPLMSGLRVTTSWTNGDFSLSENGTLVFAGGGRLGVDRRLVVVDASGAVKPFSDERREYDDLAVSGDGKRVAAVIANPNAIYEIWMADADRPALRRIVALANTDCYNPLLSADGQRIAYLRTKIENDDGVYVQPVDGSSAPQPVYIRNTHTEVIVPTSWARDGSGILFNRTLEGNSDVYFVPLTPSGAGKARPLRATPASESSGKFSPDGRLIAFESNESGRMEIYVAVFGTDGTLGPPIPVSRGATGQPFWADGRRLIYENQDSVMQVNVDRTPRLTSSEPTFLISLRKLRVYDWELLPDGKILGVQYDEGLDEIPSFTVILNWFDELKQKLAKR